MSHPHHPRGGRGRGGHGRGGHPNNMDPSYSTFNTNSRGGRGQSRAHRRGPPSIHTSTNSSTFHHQLPAQLSDLRFPAYDGPPPEPLRYDHPAPGQVYSSLSTDVPQSDSFMNNNGPPTDPFPNSNNTHQTHPSNPQMTDWMGLEQQQQHFFLAPIPPFAAQAGHFLRPEQHQQHLSFAVARPPSASQVPQSRNHGNNSSQQKYSFNPQTGDWMSLEQQQQQLSFAAVPPCSFRIPQPTNHQHPKGPQQTKKRFHRRHGRRSWHGSQEIPTGPRDQVNVFGGKQMAGSAAHPPDLGGLEHGHHGHHPEAGYVGQSFAGYGPEILRAGQEWRYSVGIPFLSEYQEALSRGDGYAGQGQAPHCGYGGQPSHNNQASSYGGYVGEAPHGGQALPRASFEPLAFTGGVCEPFRSNSEWNYSTGWPVPQGQSSAGSHHTAALPLHYAEEGYHAQPDGKHLRSVNNVNHAPSHSQHAHSRDFLNTFGFDINDTAFHWQLPNTALAPPGGDYYQPRSDCHSHGSSLQPPPGLNINAPSFIPRASSTSSTVTNPYEVRLPDSGPCSVTPVAEKSGLEGLLRATTDNSTLPRHHRIVSSPADLLTSFQSGCCIGSGDSGAEDPFIGDGPVLSIRGTSATGRTAIADHPGMGSEYVTAGAVFVKRGSDDEGVDKCSVEDV